MILPVLFDVCDLVVTFIPVLIEDRLFDNPSDSVLAIFLSWLGLTSRFASPGFSALRLPTAIDDDDELVPCMRFE